MNFSRGQTGTKVRCESCLFSQGKTHRNSQKNGREIRELFVLALSLVWFAGATPDKTTIFGNILGVFRGVSEGVFRGIPRFVCWGVFLHVVGFPILQPVEGFQALSLTIELFTHFWSFVCMQWLSASTITHKKMTELIPGSVILGRGDKGAPPPHPHTFGLSKKITVLLFRVPSWELTDPIVADPVAQDNDKRNQDTDIYGNSLLKYTQRKGDKTSQYSYLVVILSNGVPDNWGKKKAFVSQGLCF